MDDKINYSEDDFSVAANLLLIEEYGINQFGEKTDGISMKERDFMLAVEDFFANLPEPRFLQEVMYCLLDNLN